MNVAMKCPCGQKGCDAWMVSPVAAVQGVRFTEQQALDVAYLLNQREATYDLGAGWFALAGTDPSGGDFPDTLWLFNRTESIYLPSESVTTLRRIFSEAAHG